TILLRPVVVMPPAVKHNTLLPILVDVTRSMRLADEDSSTRVARAQALVRDLQSRLAGSFRLELLTFGDGLAEGDVEHLAATAPRTSLNTALTALADRHRQDRMAGVVLLSDGGATDEPESERPRLPAAPIFAVGIGSPAPPRDREIVNLTSGEPILAGASVDLSVSAVSSGFPKEAVEFRVSANGRPVDVRRVTPPADGAPLHEVFTVSPDPDVATVYTVEIPAGSGELSRENNSRSVLVPPQKGRRRILVVEGAPGFEHTFLKRALARDPGLDIDAVVRKGTNDAGRPTFFVQAGGNRVKSLVAGYPGTRAELFAYDGIIFGNIDADFFTREQLAMTADFVANRGGGLLVLGARSFDRQGLVGTPLEDVLPVDLTDRRSSVLRTSNFIVEATPNTAALTADGLAHPATRLAASVEESRKRWSDLPALAAVSLVGGPRPGAQVLAVSTGQAGDVRPLLAVQRYGQGRSLVFAGEASWRWRMGKPAADTTYETIWRQMARWLTASATGAVSVAPMAPSIPGSTDRVVVTVKNADFQPVADADVVVRVTGPDRETRQMSPALSSPQDGRYTVAVRFDQAGLYRIEASASRADSRVGTASRQVLVGGNDLEMSQPRLNESVLRRLATESGGRYLNIQQAGALPDFIRQQPAELGAPETRDLWHNGW
ncbi:MAG: glutamine amidotransferase, partial [Bryobacteraceae bacterium]